MHILTTLMKSLVSLLRRFAKREGKARPSPIPPAIELVTPDQIGREILDDLESQVWDDAVSTETVDHSEGTIYMDTLKIKTTLQAALEELKELERALDQGDQRAVGFALAQVRRELHTIEALLEEDRPKGQFRLLDLPPKDLDPETLQALDDDWNRSK